MRKFLGLFARLGWLALCVIALVSALHAYRGKSDWQVEEGLAAEMMVLAFPSSFLVVIGFMTIGFVLERFGVGLPSPSPAEMVATWFIFVIAGYFQWFLVIPYLIRRWRSVRIAGANSEENKKARSPMPE
jgi:hypothetical protein